MDLLKYNLKTEALVESQDFGLDNKEKTVATTENETIIELPLSKIKPWKDENGNKQPFLIDPEELSRLKKSIQNVGRVIQPIVVTPYENEYEIISGHKRVRACQELCIATIPARVIEVNSKSDEAMLLISANTQRGNPRPSERASCFAVYEKHRKNIKMKKRDFLMEMGISERIYDRYLKLNMMSDKFKKAVDSGRISIMAVEPLINITPLLQDKVADWSASKIISEKIAKNIKLYFEHENAPYNEIEALNYNNNTKNTNTTAKNSRHDGLNSPAFDNPDNDFYTKVFNINPHRFYKKSKSEINDIIFKALEMYFEQIKKEQK